MSEQKAFEFDEKVSQQLARLFQTEALQKLRRQYFDFFAVKEGEHVLDVGCGTGANAFALLERLQGRCRVTGVDNSESMLAIGRKNLESFPFRESMNFQATDAHVLPYPESHFGSAMIIQVLEYSKEPIRMLEEVRRVLKPGGRCFVADTDWDTIVWNSGQKEQTRRVVQLWSDHDADGWQGRKIPEYLKRSGYSDLTGGIFVISQSSFAESDYSYIVTEIVADYLIRSEKMTRAEVESWVENLKAMDRAGHYFFSLNRYAFVGRKS